MGILSADEPRAPEFRIMLREIGEQLGVGAR